MSDTEKQERDAARAEAEMDTFDFFAASAEARESREARGEKQQLRRLKQEVDCVFRRSCEPFIEAGSLVRIHAAVKMMVHSSAGPFVFDYFKDHILPSGMLILRQLLEELVPRDGLAKAFAVIWKRFFRGILPALDEIFFRVKVKSDQSVRKTGLRSFRDEIFIHYHENLMRIENDADSPDFKTIKNMLLILQSVPDDSSNKMQVERLAVALIPNYTGGMAFFEKRILPSASSVELVQDEFPSTTERRDSRQLPRLQEPKQMETLRDLFASAGRRRRHL